MRVTMVLADYAVVSDGKLNIMGGGWNITGPAPTPSAIGVLIDVPWDRANDKITLVMSLLGQDGHPVTLAGPLGEQPIEVTGEFEVGRPPGMVHGTPISVPLAFNIGPLPLPPGQRFEWSLKIDGKTQADWHLAFTTRDAAPGTATFVVGPPE